MRRKSYLMSFVAVCAFVLVAVGPTLAGGSSELSVAQLAARIHAQAEATHAARQAADAVWTLRVAGLGAGFAVGLVGGGAGAYLLWGDGR